MNVRPCNSAATAALAMAIVILPLLVYYIWYCVAFNDGNLAGLSLNMVRRFPVPTPKSFAIIAGWLLFQGLLQVHVPGKIVGGSPLPDGTRLSYKINGWHAWWLTWIVLAAGAASRLYSPAALAEELGALLTTANIFAFGFAIYLYWHGRRSESRDECTKRDSISDFWFGTQLNPRWADFDLKLFFESRPGLIGWVVLDLAFAAKQFQLNGFVSAPMILVCAFQFWYVADYFVHEEAILSTWDIRHENLGWMLCWGDLVWVPFTYTIQAQYLVQHTHDLPWWAAAGIVSLNTAGYIIFRGANLQKDRFRKNPRQLVWGRPAAYVRTSRGALLLTSGWWGLARHMNYFGDILMALAWCLPCAFASPLPYFYFVYLFILLAHRERRDHSMCAQKYGKDWEIYCAKVRYRIIPGVY